MSPVRPVRLALAVVLVVVVGSGWTPLDAGDPGAPTSKTIGPGADLALELESLSRDGVTELLLEPGVYPVFDRDVHTAPGSAEQRIVVRAADPAQPPLIRGALVLQNPRFWTLDRLRFQGARSPYDTLRINGGRDWMVTHSEFMGQRGYTAQALLNVASYQGAAPGAFRIAYNCFHHGPTAPPSVHDHMVYVTSAAPPAPSFVSRNILFGNPNGSAVKVNSSNVRVNYNTFHDVAGAVTVQENEGARPLKGVRTERNLVQSVRRLPRTDRRLVFWASGLDRKPRAKPKWLLSANYVSAGDRPTYLFLSDSDPSTVRRVGGALATRAGSAKFSSRRTCDGYRPGLPAAQRYGRWADGGLSMQPARRP